MDVAIKNADELIFGRSPQILKCGREITIGDGTVIPEINFTLPTLDINQSTWPDIVNQYQEMIHDLCQRSIELNHPEIVIELELLPPMTLKPEWGAIITRIIRDTLDDFYQKSHLRSALRVTPVDIRDVDRPPRMRSGKETEIMFRSFELCAKEGADLLSIESTGGKELHDEALMAGDLKAIIYALGVLAPRDMAFIWNEIVDISRRNHVVPAGDTACGFANTAMILADKKMIPKVLAVIIRVASLVRSLKAYQLGAEGPSKDCAYEGPFLKVITGIPISMEGKSSACAHLSQIGNISSAYCDLWSNESIPNIKLLSAFAPVVSLEQLIYDCRLMNQALSEGDKMTLILRDWLINSDCFQDPQAYIFRPEIIMKICTEIVKQSSDLEQVITASRLTLSILRAAVSKNEIKLSQTDERWLDLLSMQMDEITGDEEMLEQHVQISGYGSRYLKEEYLIE